VLPRLQDRHGSLMVDVVRKDQVDNVDVRVVDDVLEIEAGLGAEFAGEAQGCGAIDVANAHEVHEVGELLVGCGMRSGDETQAHDSNARLVSAH
jgi:hypothetical protein